MERNERGSWKSGIIFLVALVLLSAVAWVGWSLLNHRSLLPNNTVVSQAGITIGAVTPPKSLDIRSEDNDAVTQALLGNVYQTIVGKNADNAPTPGIARSWDISKDALTYTFHLNDGMHFSNGHVLDSEDVVWSLQQTITKQYAGADDLTLLASVDATAADTVRITLKSPDPALLRTLSGRAGIVYDEQAKINYSTQAAGSGPYQVADWRNGESLKLIRNQRYWGSQAKVESVTLRYFGSTSTMSKALESGELDAATGLDAGGLQKAENNTSLTVGKGVSQDSVVLAFNTDTASVLSDQRLRQAIRYLIDSDGIVKAQQGLGAAIGGPFTPLDAGYEDLTGLFPLDQAKGTSLASYFPPSYYGGSLRFIYPESYGAQLGQLIKEQLAKGGIPVTVSMISEADWKQTVESQRAFDMTLITMSSGTDAGSFANPSDTITKYDSPTAQESYKKAQASTSDEAYTAALKSYARTVAQEAPADWLFMKVPVTASVRKISGMPSNMTDSYLPLWNISSQ
ncbi:MAG: ABC transporter substrate-binding protein [Bifidobacterium psychraerophilum]|uniref:ABC transporter substrate-binding protein n=1 Tax=Bifidobacterium psychraerophilum TaxID=218140 RepID=UPI0039E7CEFD